MHLPDPETLLNIFLLASIATIIFLSIVLMFKLEKNRQLNEAVTHLKGSLEEIDEQAKLVVRTDLELNKAQEELDKKVTSLYALQQLSRAISTTLEESQIFKSIEVTHLEDFGFEKAVAFLWDEAEKKFILHLTLGFSEEKADSINTFVNLHEEIFLDLIKTEQSLSSLSPADKAAVKNKVSATFDVAFFVIAPIVPKDGNKGFFFVGTQNIDTPITEGDEESILILTNQLGQALENARLFEKTWNAHQELEKRVEERTRELTTAMAEVKRMSQRKTDFVSRVTHELRTPLTSIKGYASILLTGKLGTIPPDAKLRLEKINKHTDELVQMVNDLLDISRIESGKVTMKQESLDLKLIVDEVLDLLTVQAKDKQVLLVQDIKADAAQIFADRNQMQRVFINIISNAIKFTPAQGSITVKARRSQDAIRVDITDTGYGMPEEALGKIFEEFYRVDNPINQQVKGTGLGLTLVKHIIEAHKGKIWVTSKVGSGSTFSFTLPYLPTTIK